MRHSHAKCQRLFRELGSALGYRATGTFSQEFPTDGVWWFPHQTGIPRLPAVALEVSITEGAKALRGSIATLEHVSPACAIVVLDPSDIRRRLIANGKSEPQIQKHIETLLNRAYADLEKSRQRFELWTVDQLTNRHRMRCADSQISNTK